MVLPTFVRQAVAGEPITVHGDGSQTRCICDVSDTVRALMGLLDHPAAVGEVVNVGSDAEVSIGALAEIVKESCGSNSPVVQVPYRAAYGCGFEEVPRRVPDLVKLRSLLAFRPETTLEQSVGRVVDYHVETSGDSQRGARSRSLVSIRQSHQARSSVLLDNMFSKSSPGESRMTGL